MQNAHAMERRLAVPPKIMKSTARSGCATGHLVNNNDPLPPVFHKRSFQRQLKSFILIHFWKC
jgi:hypothetical protein